MEEKNEKRRIKICDLAEYEKNAKDTFVDTRNVCSNQLAERHFQTSSNDEPSLEAAK